MRLPRPAGIGNSRQEGFMSNRIVADLIRIEPLGPVIGARVDGIDLARPIDAASRAKLGDALIVHKVLFFENQIITPQQQRNFAAAFGKLHIHPIYPQVEDAPEIIILDTSTQNLPDNDNWHTDVTFIEAPPL